MGNTPRGTKKKTERKGNTNTADRESDSESYAYSREEPVVRDFKYVNPVDVERWKTLGSGEFKAEMAMKFATLGLRALGAQSENHKGPRCLQTFCEVITMDAAGERGFEAVMVERGVWLYARVFEWLHTLSDCADLSMYDEFFSDKKVTKEGRGVFSIALTIFLYGKPGG